MFRQAAARCLRQAMSTSGRTLQHQSAAFVTPLLQTSRTFVRSAVPAMGEVAKAGEAHVHLADLLDREVKEELENIEGDDKAEEMEAIAERIHKKFNVKETPGSTVVKMHAKHGNEKIVISYDVQDTTEDEIKPEDMDEENFEDYSVGIRALATVSKGHDKLCFSLVCTNGIWIEKVGFDNQNRDIEEDASMYWVDFTDYPEDVQEAFTAYLADRDITEDLGLFVSYSAYKKEREHYVNLLKEAKAFVGH